MHGSFLIRRLASGIGALVALSWVAQTWAGPPESPTPVRVSEGLRLFLTDWSAVSHENSKGDGLGPVYNEKSCVACHNLGGPGGAGGSRGDVQILTDLGSQRFADGSILRDKTQPSKPLSSTVFPGFATERSLVIHRYSTDPGYDLWRSSVLKSFGIGTQRGQTVPGSEFRVSTTFRNTPPLFGAGLIDSIPETVIEAASLRRIPEFPEIKGRPGRLKDHRTGRFGWKAQTASLSDFVRVACANELGLENPGHAQSPDPLRPKYQAPGFDLTAAECDSLTSFVAELPRPVEWNRAGLVKSEQIAYGREAFVTIGCAACHMPKLGDVEGIYSDLLLHDMGQGLSDSGEYYGSSSPGSPGLVNVPPSGTEWRTPPLWGLRDSAPYLHDGRAVNIQVAIALHGGEGQASAIRYKKLEPEIRQNLNVFLATLSAPKQPEEAKKAKKR
jgi:CxxC motif-containing protein (DUF1111 family)